MQLHEVLRSLSTSKHTWIRHPSAFTLTGKAEFEASGITYVVDFSPVRSSSSVWVEFWAEVDGQRTTEIINTGDPYTVFTSVLAAIEEFAKSANPQAFVFTVDNDSRRSLYEKLAKRMAASWNIKVEPGTPTKITLTNPRWQDKWQ